MKEPKHKAYELELKKSAEKLLAEVPEEAHDTARAARSQLFGWLVDMDSQTKNPGSVVVRNVGDSAYDIFLDRLATADNPKIKELSSLLRGANRDIMLSAYKASMEEAINKVTNGGALMTRSSDIFLWENTGFHADGEIKCVFAKVGREKYQPIGFDDGSMYIGSEGSKTLWVRKFSMAVMFPYTAPFEVKVEDIKPQHISDDTRLSDKEMAKIQEVIGYFDEDLSAWSCLSPEDDTARKELSFKMRETVKLACIRLPRLDQKLTELKDSHPEIGGNFENINIMELVYSCREFLTMKLEDDRVRRQIEGTTVVVRDELDTQLELVNTLCKELASLIPAEGRDPDTLALSACLDKIVVSIPGVSEELSKLDEKASALDAASVALIYLEKTRDKLTNQILEKKESHGLGEERPV